MLVAVVTDLWCHPIYNSRGACIQCMACSSQIMSEMLTEIHTREKFDFIKLIIHSQIILILCLTSHSLSSGILVA